MVPYGLKMLFISLPISLPLDFPPPSQLRILPSLLAALVFHLLLSPLCVCSSPPHSFYLSCYLCFLASNDSELRGTNEREYARFVLLCFSTCSIQYFLVLTKFSNKRHCSLQKNPIHIYMIIYMSIYICMNKYTHHIIFSPSIRQWEDI